MSLNYDLAVIGTGPAGQRAAINAAKMGKRVVIIDRTHAVGGACIHTGTIPSKAMREAVLHLTGFRMRGIYGMSYQVKSDITMHDLIFRCEHVIRNEMDVIKAQMRRNNVEMRIGHARFVDPHRLAIHGPQSREEITADYIIIATGSRPARPASVPFEPGRIIDSDGILQMEEIPRSMIIVGGGVIGVEYACMLAVLGVRITLIDQRPRLLEFIDAEIGEALQFHMRQLGIRLLLGEAVSEVLPDVAPPSGGGSVGGETAVAAVLESGKRVYGRTLMFSVGRRGATDDLNLEAAGLKADERGRIRVNEHYQTAVPHIYAAGDVIGFPALASTSAEQGRRASCHAFGIATDRCPKVMPYGIYTIPEISMVGRNEVELTEAQTPYEVGVARYREIARGQLLGDDRGMLKLIFHQNTHELLGVHILGEGATELVHIGQVALELNAPVEYFVDAVFNYPTLAECYKVAALDGINRSRAAFAPRPAPVGCLLPERGAAESPKPAPPEPEPVAAAG